MRFGGGSLDSDYFYDIQECQNWYYVWKIITSLLRLQSELLGYLIVHFAALQEKKPPPCRPIHAVQNRVFASLQELLHFFPNNVNPDDNEVSFKPLKRTHVVLWQFVGGSEFVQVPLV